MAAAETARLIASLELQDRNFTRGIRQVERGVDRVDRKLGAFSGFLNRNVGRALDSLAARGVDAIGDAIKAGSDLNEEITKSQAVFGDASDAVIDFSTTTSAALGLSQKDALAAAGNFGNMFKTVGLAEGQSADFSKTLVTLAADMASFNNEDPTDMLERIRSGLAGEAEPLRRFGVLLSAARVQEEAYASGIAKRGEKLTEAQKVQARYNLILKDTAVQQGDVAKTGGNLAGQQRKLNAMLADASAQIGTALLPAVTDVTAEFVKLFSDPDFKKGIKSFGKDLGEGAKSLVKSLKQVNWRAFADALGTAAGFAKDLVQAFLGLPSWVQAAVIGGWGLNKVTGGLLGDVASGLIKGILGINAGVVNLRAGTVTGVGGGAAGAATGGAGKLLSAVRILGAVTIAGASIAALAQAFKDFQTTVTESQKSFDEKVESTRKQNFRQTIDNLQSVVKAQKQLNIGQQALSLFFSGGELTKNFELAAQRIAEARQKGELSPAEMRTALAALQATADQFSGDLSIPGVEAEIKALAAAIDKSKPGSPDPKDERGRAGRAKGGERRAIENPTSIANQVKGVSAAIKNAQSIASRENSALGSKTDAQKAELGNIKNNITTMDANQRAAAVAAAATTVLQGALQAGRDAVQRMTTSQAGTNAANAARGAGDRVSGAISSQTGAITRAIWASAAAYQPIIQSTTVIQKYSTSERGGASSDSRTRSGQ